MQTSPDALPPIGGTSVGTAPAADSLTAEPQAKASGGLIATYCFAQFGNWLALLTPVVVTIALRVSQIATDAEKAAQLGIVLGVGAFASLVATPLWGAISDRTTARVGRRKLWMIVGIAGGGIGLAIMAAAPNMLMLGIGWIVCQVAFNANQAALNAVLPDAIPEIQRGRVSGLLGLSTTVAILAGAFMTQMTNFNPFLMFLAPWAVAVISLLVMLAKFQDRPADPASIPPYTLREFGRTFWISPRRHPDFAWAFASRFLVFLGAAFLTTYQVYYLTDRLKVSVAEVATYIFISTLVTSAVMVVVSIPSGYLSDKAGRRKPFVLAAAIIAGAGLLVIGFSATFSQFLIGVVIESAGVGVYYAVDLALVAAVLPDPDNAAKDMGVFQIAGSLPQALAPAIAPVFLVIGTSGTASNYTAVFIAATAFAIIGAFLILPVRRTR